MKNFYQLKNMVISPAVIGKYLNAFASRIEDETMMTSRCSLKAGLLILQLCNSLRRCFIGLELITQKDSIENQWRASCRINSATSKG